MMWIAGLIGGMGLVCMVSRKSILGLLVGVQLLILGSSMMFVLAGYQSGYKVQGHLLGFFVTLSGMAQIVSGFALAIRMFFLKKKILMDDLQGLKH